MRSFIFALVLVGCSIDETEGEPGGSETDVEPTDEQTSADALAPIDELGEPGGSASAPVPTFIAIYHVPVPTPYVLCTTPKNGGPQQCVQLVHDVIHEISCYRSCEYPYHVTCFEASTQDFWQEPDAQYLVSTTWFNCGAP